MNTKAIRSNLCVKRILLAACVDNRLWRWEGGRAEAESHEQRLLQQPNREMMMEMGDIVRSQVYVKERTYRICRKTGHGVCEREEGSRFLVRVSCRMELPPNDMGRREEGILGRCSGVPFWTI